MIFCCAFWYFIILMNMKSHVYCGKWENRENEMKNTISYMCVICICIFENYWNEYHLENGMEIQVKRLAIIFFLYKNYSFFFFILN